MVAYKGTSIEQIDTLRWVLESGLIRDWRIAIDGGANVGEWTQIMAARFQTVHAFEPGDVFRATAPNIILHREALLDRPCMVTLNTKRKSRGWWVSPDEAGTIQAVTIDSLNLPACGFIKLDLEGADGLALLGAAETIKRCAPVVMVEMGKQNRKRPCLSNGDTVQFLNDRGYWLVKHIGCDFIFARTNGVQ